MLQRVVGGKAYKYENERWADVSYTYLGNDSTHHKSLTNVDTACNTYSQKIHWGGAS